MIRIVLSTRLGERRWTQAYLSKITGIRAATINKLYHEVTDKISLDHLEKICKALDCDISDILKLEDEEDHGRHK